ncbi:MAG: hypothetical protein OEU32_03465 [Acidimicrobiia bacterium]|nr:hypothetical protein [Acidimicrobiia bacterium]
MDQQTTRSLGWLVILTSVVLTVLVAIDAIAPGMIAVALLAMIVGVILSNL